MSILDVQHIEKNFGATKVLKDINFSLDEGQVLAIIGSSGSGKTTLLRCLNFLETPNTGRIDDILRMVKEYHADGVIDCSLKFCCLYDTEKYAVSRAMKEAGVPVLELETDYTDTDAEQLRTRIGAFVEMLNA